MEKLILSLGKPIWSPGSQVRGDFQWDGEAEAGSTLPAPGPHRPGSQVHGYSLVK